MTAPSTALTPTQLRFADAYLRTPPSKSRGSEAAVIAGFAKKSARNTARRMMQNDAVATYVREREGVIKEHLEEKQLVTREWVVHQLVKVYHQSMIGEPEMVWVDGKMEHSGLWTFNDRGANRSLELLGKEIGMFKESGKGEDTPFNLIIDLGQIPERPKPAAVQQKMVDVTPQPVIDSPQQVDNDLPEIDLG